MENEENDIIRQLAEKLRAHQEPYKEGAWEQFVRHEAAAFAAQSAEPAARIEKTGTKQRTLLRPWMAVAAALLLAVGAGWLYMSLNQTTHLNGVASSTKQGHEVAKDSKGSKGIPSASTPTPIMPQKAAQAAISGQTNMDAQGDRSVPAGSLAISSFNNDLKEDAKSEGKLLQNHPYHIGQRGVIILNNHFATTDQAAARQIAENALASINQPRQLLVPGLQISPVGPVFTVTAPKAASTAQRPYNAPSNQNSNNRVLQNNTALSATNQRIKPSAQPLADNAKVAGAGNQSNNRQAFDHFDDKGYFDVADNNGSSRKWHMGVMVVPAVSNSAKLNMGYGLSVGYKLSNRLSLASGLSYAELTGSKDAGTGQGQSLASIASSGRTLTALDASLTGLNVPLEIRYQVSSKIYVGTGVSAMAVLSDKVERRYAIAQMQSSALEANTGYALKPDAMQSIASNLNKREVIPDQEVGAKDFAGFINFSLGFKQPLNKSKSLSIEPFVSVPMSNNLFNQNIKMTNGGLRIKLGL